MVMQWTSEEETRLIELYTSSDKTIPEISVELNKNLKAVKGKIARLKVKNKIESRHKKWSEEDDIYLELLSNDKESTLREAANFLGRSRGAVVTRMVYLRKTNKNIKTMRHVWTDDEIERLKALYPYQNSYLLAKYFRTSRHSVLKKAESLGLTGNKVHFIKHLDGKVRKLCAEGWTRREIAEELHLPYHTVKKYIWENKIDCQKAETSQGWLDYNRQMNQIYYAERQYKQKASKR